MAVLRFYLDENLPIAIAIQLNQRGIVATTARDLGTLGESDVNHLARAGSMGYIFCTYDTDFIALAHQMEHAGVIMGQFEKHWIGEWVKALTLYHAVYSAEDMHNRLEYL